MEKTILPISVLIPTMNRPDTLKKTLDSYMEADCLPKQIVVVDQSSSASVSDQIKNLTENYGNNTKFVYIYQEISSLTKARNNALQFAEEEIVICSDDDIDVYNNTLSNVFEKMKNPSIAMIAGIDDNTPHSKTNIGYFLGTKSFKYRNIGHVTKSLLGRFPDHVGESIETMWAMGFFFVIRKSLMDKWKIVWDENLVEYAYAEDLDFSYSYYKKAKADGMDCIISNQIHVKHMVSTEYRIPSRKRTCMYVVNRRYICKKHGMSISAEFAMWWCDIWRYVERKIHHQRPEDLKDALKYACLHRNDIKSGRLTYLD